ncbi:hypothetical protein D3C81_865150 [compost metagenome]
MVDDPLQVAAKVIITGWLASPSLHRFRIIGRISIGEPLRHDLIKNGLLRPFRYPDHFNFVDIRELEAFAGRMGGLRLNSCVQQVYRLRPGGELKGIGKAFIFGTHSNLPIVEHAVMSRFFHRQFLVSSRPVVFVPGHRVNLFNIIPFGPDAEVDRHGVVSISPFIPGNVVERFKQHGLAPPLVNTRDRSL